MANVYPEISEDLRRWIEDQKMFFVATAALDIMGSVNCSPKGLGTFRIIGKREAIYLDLTGSGVETIAHLKENGRIVIMFCAFEGAPRIVRLHGHGTVHETSSPKYQEYASFFPDLPGPRSTVHIDITRISDSCGFGVPLYQFKGQRDSLPRWWEKIGEDGVREYQLKENASSIDGLPGVSTGAMVRG